jgi:hypothetical protein
MGEPEALFSQGEIDEVLNGLRQFEALGIPLSMPRIERRAQQSTSVLRLSSDIDLGSGLGIRCSSVLEKQGIGKSKRHAEIKIDERTGSMDGRSEVVIFMPQPTARDANTCSFSSRIGHGLSSSLEELCGSMAIDQIRPTSCMITHEAAAAKCRVIASWLLQICARSQNAAPR